MNLLSQRKQTILPLLVTIVLGCLGILPSAKAVDPPPDGGYPGDTTAEGDNALFRLTSGFSNTAVGSQALYSNTAGLANTANGAFALQFNTTGSGNTATGAYALWSNTAGPNNTANGDSALQFNTNGSYNAANGAFALQFNTTGFQNTANGALALWLNSTGSKNTANGAYALQSNSTGFENTANGAFALQFNTTGYNNTAAGFFALINNTTGNSNIALGVSAGASLTTGSNNIDIGHTGVADESGVIRLGTKGTQTATFIAGIRETPIAVGVAVGITADGQLGVRASSARFKEAIKPMDKASEVILALKPVTFRYKHELDPEGTPQFGLVAEDVEKVNPDFVARDDQGKPYTVRYEAVNAMLLNEFLKEHAKVEQLKKDFESKTAKQQKQIDALTAGLQKVSAELELRKSAPQTVLNDR